MTQLVVDASFTGAWLLPDENSAAADEVLGLALQGKAQLCAPDLWTYELFNLLIMAERRGRIDPPQIPGALHLIQQVPITLYDHSTLLSRSRTATFASRFSLSAYEASYIELADRLQVPLRTLDQPLSQAAESLGLG